MPAPDRDRSRNPHGKFLQHMILPATGASTAAGFGGAGCGGTPAALVGDRVDAVRGSRVAVDEEEIGRPPILPEREAVLHDVGSRLSPVVPGCLAVASPLPRRVHGGRASEPSQRTQRWPIPVGGLT